ncbi:MAG: DedA family protein [Bacilli bacterium]|nr:DedA family protein [Bacilli bacterium]
MDTFILGLMDNYGYYGMFLGMVLEAVIIIIPSELILASSGILVSKKVFTFTNAFLVGLLGSVFCAIIIYLMGYFGGEVFIKKYGKYFFMKDEDISKSNTFLEKYGLISALIGRNIPIVRTLISLPIGIMRLSFIKFLIYTIIGSIPWTLLFVYLGYSLGENWVFMNTILDYLKLPIVLIIIIFLANIYRKKIKVLRK